MFYKTQRHKEEEEERQQETQQRRFILHINRQSTKTVWTYFEAHDFSNLPPNIQDTMKDVYDFQREIGSGSRIRSRSDDGGGGSCGGGGGQPTGIWYKAVRDHSTTRVTTVGNTIDRTENPISSRSSRIKEDDDGDHSQRTRSSSHSPTWEFAMTLQRTIGYKFINQTEREKCYRGESAMMELVFPADTSSSSSSRSSRGFKKQLL